MKTLLDILNNLNYTSVTGITNVNVHGISINSNQLNNSNLFIAVKGVNTDGHSYIEQAISNGANIIYCEKVPNQINTNVTYVLVKDTSAIIGKLASFFFDNPSHDLKVIGITGTNGKTTCATLLFQLFTKLGYQCGLISTINNQIANTIIPSTHTTPDAIMLQSLFAQMKSANCTHVFMEVSSHALKQKRINGTIFTGACFTNITHDHLDYHKTFEEYISVKKSLFDQLQKNTFALTNVDDKRGLFMLQDTKARKKTFSINTMADYRAKVFENNLSGLGMMIESNEVYFKMIGEFNAYNLLLVYGTAIELGEDKSKVLQILSTLSGAEGRFDYMFSEKHHIMGIIDYAHTPDALLNVLATINKLREGNETLFTILGCGGDRDKTKRPLMATVACEYSDKVIITSDNPRSENITDIIKEMEKGIPVNHLKKCVNISDRKEAIKAACSIADDGDIIFVAGKGHEKYQEINGIKYPFDDKKILKEMFELFEK